METIVIFTNAKYLAMMECSNIHVDENNLSLRLDRSNDKQFIFCFDGIQQNQINALTSEVAEGSVYLLHHSKPYEAILKEVQNGFSERGMNVVPPKNSSHSDASTYGRIKDLDKNINNLDMLQKIFDLLIEKIKINEVYELFICTWKTLSYIKIKIKNGTINSSNYSENIIPLKGWFKKRINDISESEKVNEKNIDSLLDNFDDIKNHDNMMAKFWNDNIRKHISEFPST